MNNGKAEWRIGRMKMKDRLVELIKQGENAFADKYKGEVMSHIDKLYDFIADYLIANGMVVPPCKLGQKVYRTKGNFGGVKIYEGVVDQIVLQDDGQEWFYVYGHPLHFTADDIGKTVFLNREDAERALKGDAEE